MSAAVQTAAVQGDTGLAEAADKLRALAAEHAAAADTTRKLATEVTQGIREAGFARHFVAARWGGQEGTFDELTRAVTAVGEGCAAAAWCASLAAYSARFASHLPEEGHRAVWGESPDVVIATALMPVGRARAVDGGWQLSGRWSYVSGVDFADWVLVCGAVPGVPSGAASGAVSGAPSGAASGAAPGAPSGTAPGAVPGDGGPPQLRFFAVPRGQWTVQESWDSIGMRATASHTVVLDGVTVPAHLSFDRADMLTGRNRTSSAACHQVPFQAVGGLTFIAPVVGAAVGALAACARTMTGRRRNQSGELLLVRASGRIDAARHLVRQNAEVIDERSFTPELMARNERNATFAAELLQEAVGLLIRGAGTGGLGEAHPLQRFWRDITSATSHIALQYDTAARKNYSAVLLGPEEA